jgi:hypothetical protein
MTPDRIVPNIFPNPFKRVAIRNSNLRESPLPNRSAETEILPGTKCKPTLDELYGLLNADFRANRNQKVKVIWHNDKLVQTISLLSAIVVQNTKKKRRRSVRLKQIPLLSDGGGHEERARSRNYLWKAAVSVWNGHTQRLKPFRLRSVVVGTPEGVP